MAILKVIYTNILNIIGYIQGNVGSIWGEMTGQVDGVIKDRISSNLRNLNENHNNRMQNNWGSSSSNTIVSSINGRTTYIVDGQVIYSDDDFGQVNNNFNNNINTNHASTNNNLSMNLKNDQKYFYTNF